MKSMILTLVCATVIGIAYGQTTGSGELRCQYSNGTLMAVATVCNDNISSTTCESVFGGSASGTSRPALCDSTDLQSFAAQCSKTCGICCELPQYDCEDDTTYTAIDCTLNRDKCTNANWTNVMAQYCPQTCGLCNQGTCRDLNGGCNDMISLCQNVQWQSYMATNCARTCGTCTTSSTCTDIASNCASITSLCTNSVYLSLMKEDCASTCGYCSSSGSGSSSCTDSSSSCATWVANGFCTNSFYTTAIRQQYCASSCGLC